MGKALTFGAFLTLAVIANIAIYFLIKPYTGEFTVLVNVVTGFTLGTMAALASESAYDQIFVWRMQRRIDDDR